MRLRRKAVIKPQGRTLTAIEQSQIALLARLGDPDAANELTLSVWDWVYRTAYKYSRRSGFEVDELASVMFEAMPKAIDKYRAKSGSFLNYFAYAAGRRVTRYIRIQGKKIKGSEQLYGSVEPPGRPTPDTDATEEVAYIFEELGLKPFDRYILLGMSQNPNRKEVLRMASHIGWQESRVKARYTELIGKLQAEFATQ
jgi:RNA polymerase sigma factor (sigma-70 family)